jgi:hypothetical protein
MNFSDHTILKKQSELLDSFARKLPESRIFNLLKNNGKINRPAGAVDIC